MTSAHGGSRPGAAIRVAIIEDDRPTREGLSLLIGGTQGFRCVASSTRVEELARMPLAEDPDVLLVDIDLPGMSGSDGVPLLKARYPSVQIVMLTVYADQDKVFQAICNGACGYLLKETAPARLLEAIREAHGGGAPMSPDIARKVVTAFQKASPPARDDHLTAQEIRLLQLLSEGYSYEGASHHLNVSVNTVRNYIRSIYDKLHVHSKSEAVSKALRSRVIR